MVRIKICGITNREDALKAASLGAWALGFNFYKKSPRFIAPARAKKIIQELPPFITPVGIFVNQPLGAIRDIIGHCNLGAVQLHGDEDHNFCHRLRRYGAKIIKVFRVRPDFDPAILKDYHVDAFYSMPIMTVSTAEQVKHSTGRSCVTSRDRISLLYYPAV